MHRSRRLVAVLLVVLVFVAGCSGTDADPTTTATTVDQPSPTGTPTAGGGTTTPTPPPATATRTPTTTPTASPTPSPTPTPVRTRPLDSVQFPPGTDRDGIADPAALLAAHRDHVRNGSYRTSWRFRQAIGSEFGPPDDWTFGNVTDGRASYDTASNGTLVSTAGGEYRIQMRYELTNSQPDDVIYQFPGGETVFSARSSGTAVFWDTQPCHPTVIPGRSIEASPEACHSGGRVQEGRERTPVNWTEVGTFHEQQFGLLPVAATVLTRESFVADRAVVSDGRTYVVFRTREDTEAAGTAVVREDGLVTALDVRYGETTYLNVGTETGVNRTVGTPSWADAARNGTVYYDFEKARAPAGDPNCEDFATQAGAQIYHESTGGAGLDGDGDGRACEALP